MSARCIANTFLCSEQTMGNHGTQNGNESGYSNEVSVIETATDSDNDGLSDSLETLYGLNPAATDSDGDGISDLIEFGSFQTPLDSDGDGTYDALDLDSDDDGVADSVEGSNDADNDGTSDLDEDGVDCDQDGIPDRLDNKAATMATAQGKMSVVVNHISAALAQTTFIENITSSSDQPNVDFPTVG